jgi:phage antirepressor YoqD-like protein
MKYISTTALAKELDLSSKQLFSDLSEKGWVYRKDEQWNLTKEGKVAGGKMNYNPRFG